MGADRRRLPDSGRDIRALSDHRLPEPSPALSGDIRIIEKRRPISRDIVSSAPTGSLNSQITALENRIALHHLRINSGKLALQQTIRRRITSSEAVITAFCLGAALGRSRDSSNWSLLTALNAINAGASLISALLPWVKSARRESVPPHPD
jgi:hypothetical protein